MSVLKRRLNERRVKGVALLNCKECNRQVSTEAKRCPNCGAKAPKKPVSTWQAVFIIAIFSILIYSCNKIEQTPLSPQEKLQKTIRHVAYACGNSIKETLNDPKSAEFDYDHAHVTPVVKGASAYWNVQLPLRAKNSFNATILVVYQCRVKSTGEDTWEVLNIKRVG
jgi:hypothetical protein